MPAKTKIFFELLKEHEVEFVDFRFTDQLGKWHHISYIVDQISEDLLNNGIAFDASSLPGWQRDLLLIADTDTTFIDPFTAQPTAVICCDVKDLGAGDMNTHDPRSTAKRAEAYLQSSKIANKALFSPEIEFFIFNDVRFQVCSHKTSVEIDCAEGAFNSGRKCGLGAFSVVPPLDSLHDIRAEMLTVLKNIGIQPVSHNHEKAPSQCALNFMLNTLVNTADNIQKYKYVVQNVAHSYGKTATFMPQPIRNSNGSGMHVQQSIWHDDKPLFAGADNKLSELCLYYIGGIIKHARALNAFTNPATNSYKRLATGSAPTLLAYSDHNKHTAIRIPYCTSAKDKSIEARFPDPASNPYYAFAAMLMAGLDGIENKIHPGEALNQNQGNLPANNRENICSSLRDALAALSNDRNFLTTGNVFSDEQIDAYINLKMAEIQEVEQAPQPIEFSLYYSS